MFCFGIKKKKLVIKWIIETAALSENEIKDMCILISICIKENFNKNQWNQVFIKSSTGVYKTKNNEPNGATLEDIKLMLEYSNPFSIKASGGIKTKNEAIIMIQLGVKRIGTSSALALIN